MFAKPRVQAGDLAMADHRADPFPSADAIADRAYELFVSGGRDRAQLPDCWRRAETELLNRAADRLIADYLRHPPDIRPA